MMNNYKLEVKWAIIFTICSILWMILEKGMGLHDAYISEQAIYTNLFAIVAAAVYVFALLDKKRNFFNGKMNWTQGFISGLVLSIFVALLTPVSQYIVFTYISPDFFGNFISYVVKNKIHTQVAAENYFNVKSYMIQGGVGAISMGVVTSAIVSLFVKTKEFPA